LFILACALVVNYETFGAIDVSTRVSTNPFSVFFGWGCASYWTEFPMPCPEQIVTTMPFYAAAAYSLGAFMALRRSPATAVV
jgi:hypothetical protein